jgi:hypothetical protein
MSRALLGAVVLLTTVVAAGCNEAAAPTAPTAEVAIVTENFAGTLTINGAITHPFVVGTPGSVTTRLVAVSPNSDIPVGMSLGTWNTTTETCQIVISNDFALQGRTIVGTAQTSGAFCVRVYDVGRLTESTSYEVQVTHQ